LVLLIVKGFFGLQKKSGCKEVRLLTAAKTVLPVDQSGGGIQLSIAIT
jgi:hypothetical protein